MKLFTYWKSQAIDNSSGITKIIEN